MVDLLVPSLEGLLADCVHIIMCLYQHILQIHFIHLKESSIFQKTTNCLCFFHFAVAIDINITGLECEGVDWMQAICLKI